MTATDQAAATTFSERVRATSWAAHGRAQHSGFMSDLFAGKLDRRRFADLVAQEYFIYEVIEKAAAEMRGRPVAGPFVRPELFRLPSLERDLAALIGPGWASEIAATPPTVTYCDRLREVCIDWEGGFIAHHYVRYMGDLSGGQQIKKVIARHHGTDATSFYDFDEIADPDAFRQEFRALLDAAPWDEAEQQRVIDEVLLAYDLNTRLLGEL